MELARAEKELAKPINWGERAYWNIKNRQNEAVTREKRGEVDFSDVLPLDSIVRHALEQHPTIHGPLELDPEVTLEAMTQEEQSRFFSHYTQLEILTIQKWHNISSNSIRALSMTCGACLLEVDFSYSSVNSAHLEVLLVRTDNLRALKLANCHDIGTGACNFIVQLAHRHLQELSLFNCPQISSEGLLWLGGAAGVSRQGMSKLRALDLGRCDLIDDRGMIAIAKGCPRLACLNLEECQLLSDSTIIALASHCPRMALLNLSGLSKISTKGAMAIGGRGSIHPSSSSSALHTSHSLNNLNLTAKTNPTGGSSTSSSSSIPGMPSLRSLNLARCPAIVDKGVMAIANHCRQLQALSLAGLRKISEAAIYHIAAMCPGLLVLNLTGCDRVTVNGLHALLQGLPKGVHEAAVSFFGLRPADRGLALRLEQQLRAAELRREEEAAALEKQRLREEQMRIEAEERHMNHNASLIAQYIFRYKLRQGFYRKWKMRIRQGAAGLIQRLHRGRVGRKIAKGLKLLRLRFLSLSPFALKIQKNVRAYLIRLGPGKRVARTIRELYLLRQREGMAAAMVHMQAAVRRHIAANRCLAKRELRVRRRINEQSAAILMQTQIRLKLARLLLIRMRLRRDNLITARLNASQRIAAFCAEGMRRFKAKLSGEELRRFFREKWAASEVLQRVYRGHRARERVNHMLILQASREVAAREIQRMFRGTRVLHWRDMRLNVIAAYVLDRHYVERRERVIAARERFAAFAIENQKDSASEPDDVVDPGEDYPWTEGWDVKKNAPFWSNYLTNEVTYDEPLRPLAHELALVGERARVFWVVQGAWYEGTIVRYHRRKQRHRIDYDDGDHEWLQLDVEAERVQIGLSDGSFAMYRMYESESLAKERAKGDAKREHEMLRQQAFADALQWRSFVDDKNSQIMFMSTRSGELRKAAEGGLQWTVRDDGHGFPCFVHMETGQTVYEDPRFVADPEEDLAASRKFVLAELRLAVYLGRSLWEEYTQATSLNDDQDGNMRAVERAMNNIRQWPKLPQLAALLIRAKALHEASSSVDRPMHGQVMEEIVYAQWLAARLAEVSEQAEHRQRERKDNKLALVQKLAAKSGLPVNCRYCQRSTKRHLDFCPNCGKPQVFLE